MKIVLLERNSAGADVPVDCFNELGEVTSYPNTVTAQEVAERVGDADVIIVCNKAPMKEESLKDCPNVKLICELATGYDNCDLAHIASQEASRWLKCGGLFHSHGDTAYFYSGSGIEPEAALL